MPEVKWIDSDGQQRIHHDDNYQLVMKHGEDDSLWLKMHSWNIDFAAKLILLGYTENVEEQIDFFSRQKNRIDNDRADIMKTIINRFDKLAQSAINIGVLQKPDTPANWLAWAQSKGYKINHLISENQVVSVAVDHEGTDTKDNKKLNKSKNSKLQRQQKAILDTINAKGFDPMAIPDGEKGTIKLIFELDDSVLFKYETAFDRAWKLGIGKLWQMENHNSYAHRGNN